MDLIMSRSKAGTGDRTMGERAAPLLAVLSAVFLLRVVAQAAQWVGDVDWLPAFDAWQSGAVPYAGLFASQLAILGLQFWLIVNVRSGRFDPSPAVGLTLFGLGLVYFLFMLFRLIAGFTFLTGHSWFDAPLPSLFHMVLAAFIVVVSRVGSTTPDTSATTGPIS